MNHFLTIKNKDFEVFNLQPQCEDLKRTQIRLQQKAQTLNNFGWFISLLERHFLLIILHLFIYHHLKSTIL